MQGGFRYAIEDAAVAGFRGGSDPLDLAEILRAVWLPGVSDKRPN